MDVLLVLLGTALFIGIPMWYVVVYKKRKPKTWVVKGRAPPFLNEALAIIAQHTPGLPQAGYIEWVDGPFVLVGQRVAGAMFGTNPIRIKLMYVDPIENSALAHELGHAWSELTSNQFGESPADTAFAAWFGGINREIAKARLAASPS